MKKKENVAPCKHIRVQVSVDQYTAILHQFEKTTYRNLSEFLRDKLMGNPISIKVRNVTADEFLVTAAEIKKELLHYRLLLSVVFEEESVRATVTPDMTLSYLTLLKEQIKIVGDVMNELYELIRKK